ncbi:MAG: cbb3-type cytochrome oxidase assembly protein CcoS [Steroidobacteraceae bacterium]|nr:cbb3-type cytochrome oxidase assembly protein CcoS [Steroidobacteraceae bacterium]MDW8257881.1 cbb3-type cytochrome oxidase assembly protein CcoS [Gammaproteobacteria bacterium]
MSSAFWLIPLSLVLLAVAVWAFFWAVDRDQFDELEAHGRDVFDDDRPS